MSKFNGNGLVLDPRKPYGVVPHIVFVLLIAVILTTSVLMNRKHSEQAEQGASFTVTLDNGREAKITCAYGVWHSTQMVCYMEKSDSAPTKEELEIPKL